MRFDRPKGQRINRYFWGITNYDGLWWVAERQKWLPYSQIKFLSAQNWVDCKTLRAFRRHMRKHPELKGKAVLISRYVGYDVYA